MLYTNAQKDAMLEEVKNIAIELIGQFWHGDGAYIVSDDGQLIINVWDYMDDFMEFKRVEGLREYVRQLIEEQKEEEK